MSFDHRFRLLGWALVLLLLSLPAGIPLIVATVVGLGMIPLTVGVPLFVLGVILTRRVADLHRWIFASALDVRIRRPYRPVEGHIGRQLLAYLRDPATWRDLLWLLVNINLGFAAYMVVVTLFGSIVWYAALPLLWAILEQSAGAEVATNVLRTDFGVWGIDSQAAAWTGIPIGLLFLLLWWWLTPPIMRGYARLSGTLLGPTSSTTLSARVQQLTESRAVTVDTQAAELRRIERDLHDGAQARLVALGMSLGMAEELLTTDPAAAGRLLAEARQDSGQALTELRDLVRGMHPPVLADRGLAGAVQALALAHPLPVEVTDELPGRLPAPVESAAYFATAELLTNITKHAQASAVQIQLGYADRRLYVTVGDNGRGGAVSAAGGGLHGVQRRLSAFDGAMDITSPVGGPTVVTMEIPADLVGTAVGNGGRRMADPPSVAAAERSLLPPLVQPQPTARVPPSRTGENSKLPALLSLSWRVWLAAVSVNLVIWFLVAISSGNAPYFWPMWVAGPWAAANVALMIFLPPRRRP